MKILRLPHGPWKLLMSGEFENYPLSIYQNPDRDLLVVVVDREEGKPKGVVVVMYRGFLAEGPVDALVQGTKREFIVMKKKREDGLYTFILLQGGPRYIGLSSKDLEEAVERVGNALYKDTELFLQLAKGFDVELKLLRDCDARTVSILLSEPILLPKLVRTPSVLLKEERFVVLGKTRVGVAKEIVDEFRRAVIEGPHETCRKRFLTILVEELARNGYPVIVFTRDVGKYQGLERAGNEDLSFYSLKPMGFHWQTVTPGKDIFVDVGSVSPDAFLDVIGVGGKVGEVIKGVMAGRRVTVQELVKSITGNRFVDGQARRVLTIVERKYKHFFGINDVGPYLSTGGLGSITIVSYEESPWHLLTLQSFLEKLFLFASKRGMKDFFLLFEDAHRLFLPIDSPINRALSSTLQKLMGLKVGVVLECESMAFLRKEIQEKIETVVKTVNDQEVGVRPLTRRPYRVELRPFLSGVKLSQAPLASAQQAPQPGGR